MNPINNGVIFEIQLLSYVSPSFNDQDNIQVRVTTGGNDDIVGANALNHL